MLGYKELTTRQIELMYGKLPVYANLQYPKTTRVLEGTSPHWVLLDRLDVLKIPVICHIVDLIVKGKILEKSYLKFAFDLIEVQAIQTNNPPAFPPELRKLSRE